jgi:excisionase family DNA binding protein
MTAQHRTDAQLLLPVMDPTDVDGERFSDARRQAVVRVAARPVQRQPRARPTAERSSTHVVATPADGPADPQPAADGDRLLFTVPEAARALHIGRRQAWELVWRGELPVVRLGRSVRIARPALERFVADRSAPYGA